MNLRKYDQIVVTSKISGLEQQFTVLGVDVDGRFAIVDSNVQSLRTWVYPYEYRTGVTLKKWYVWTGQ